MCDQSTSLLKLRVPLQIATILFLVSYRWHASLNINLQRSEAILPPVVETNSPECPFVIILFFR
jgi:hypothetical protein